jgi:hypothetical protein
MSKSIGNLDPFGDFEPLSGGELLSLSDWEVMEDEGVAFLLKVLDPLALSGEECAV